MNELCKDIMLDIESMGVTPGSMILSIAAVPFYYDRTIAGEILDFYEKISVNDSQLRGFTCDIATTTFWNKQEESVKQEAISGTKGVIEVLDEFAAYIKQLTPGVRIWGNSSAFDNVMIRGTYAQMNLDCPFTFRQDMCYRTLKNLFPAMVLDKPSAAHNALADARAQALNAERIMHFMFRGAVS